MAIEDSYKATDFQVYSTDGKTISIRVDQENSALDEFLKNSINWAFITAWNPYPKKLNQEENTSQNKQLEELLIRRQFTYHKGAGVPDNSDWDPEESFLIVDITKEDALSIGKQFGQKAIVLGQKGQQAELLFC